MRNAEYWADRFVELESLSHKTGAEACEKIAPAFDKAMRDIDAQIEVWYGRFSSNNKVSMQEARKLLNSSELKELKWDVGEYIKYGKENAMNQSWMKELENASAKFHISRLEALKIRTQQAVEVAFGNELDYVDEMARKVYTENYYHSIFELQKGFNIGWEIGQIDERKLNTLISKPWAADGKNFSERIWDARSQLVSELHNQLTRTCILGKGPDDAIKSIAKRFNVSKNQAGRLVMTEQAYFHSVSQKDAFNELDIKEFENVATLDSLTSEICQEMDGKHFLMKDYQPGVTAPPFHPWCRTATAPYFNDEFSLGEKRAARDENGKTYYVSADMKYGEWKKKYVADAISESDLLMYNKYNIILGKDMPNIEKFIEMKYNDNDKYEILKRKYKLKEHYQKVYKSGHISKLVDFETYSKLDKEISDVLYGIKTVDNIVIKSHTLHFIDRVIGHIFNVPMDISRNGVAIKDVQDTLINYKSKKVKEKSIKLFGAKCIVTINPKTNTLIQTNPLGKEK